MNTQHASHIMFSVMASVVVVSHPSCTMSTVSTFMSKLRSFIPQVVRNRPIACIVGFEVFATIAAPYYVSVFSPFLDGRNCTCLCHAEGGHECHQSPWLGQLAL